MDSIEKKEGGTNQLLKEMLDIESIVKVYYVDEERDLDFSIDKIKGLIIAASSKGVYDEIRKIRIERYSLDVDFSISSNNIDSFWGNISDPERNSLVERVARITDEKWLLNAKISGSLNTLFSNTDVAFLLPEEWDNEHDSIVKTLNENERILVLFDEETNYRKRGRDFIVEVKSKSLLESVIPVLYTNEIFSIDQELPHRDLIIKELEGSLTLSDFFALSKHRIYKDDHFIDGIKKSLLNRYCEQIKNTSIEILEKAFENSIKKIKTIDTYDFDNVVLKSSFQEGIWEAFTFHRIANILYEDEIFEEMRIQGYVKSFNHMIRKSKAISDINVQVTIDKSPYKEKLALRNKELYQSSETINSLHLPLENGDIFLTPSDGRYFILIGQECDMMLRVDNKAKRNENVIPGSRNTKVAMLLPIEFFSEKTKITESKFELKYLSQKEEKTGIVDFKRPVYVDYDFLDLTVFDGSGYAKLNIQDNKIDPINLNYALLERYKIIVEKISKQMQVCLDLKSKIRGTHKVERETIWEKCLPVFSFPDNLQIKVSFDFSKMMISVDIQRFARLRLPFSKHLLDKFTKYQSRNAELHDFVPVD